MIRFLPDLNDWPLTLACLVVVCIAAGCIVETFWGD